MSPGGVESLFGAELFVSNNTTEVLSLGNEAGSPAARVHHRDMRANIENVPLTPR